MSQVYCLSEVDISVFVIFIASAPLFPSAKLFVKNKTLYGIKMCVNYLIFPILLHGWIMVDINP